MSAPELGEDCCKALAKALEQCGLKGGDQASAFAVAILRALRRMGFDIA